MKGSRGSAGRLHREMEIAPGPSPMNSNFQEMCAFPLPHLLLSLLRLTLGNDLQDDESVCVSTVGSRRVRPLVKFCSLLFLQNIAS